MKIAVFFAVKDKTLSYNDDWIDAFIQYNKRDVHINIYNIFEVDLIKWVTLLRNNDWLIFLHSTNSNGILINRVYQFFLLYRRAKIVFFVGNEYKLMPKKISLLNFIKAEIVISQLPEESAKWLYSEVKSKVITLPHALNPFVFRPIIPLTKRNIDIGGRSYPYPLYLGDIDRSKVSKFVDLCRNKGFKVDYSIDPKKRFSRNGWVNFLNKCKFTISSEAGTSYLEKTDKTRKLVNKYLKKNPNARYKDIYKKFFENYKEPVSGKCISSRHFDSIGTKTCQILIEGRYNNILKPDEHYIELKKDFSNINEVIEKMKDDKLRKLIVENAYEYVINNHTHKHRLQYLFDNYLK